METIKRLKRAQTYHLPIKSHGNSARSEKEKAKTFSVHFSKISKPNSPEITLEEQNRLFPDDTTPGKYIGCSLLSIK